MNISYCSEEKKDGESKLVLLDAMWIDQIKKPKKGLVHQG